MIIIKYFGPNSESIPKQIDYTQGLTVGSVIQTLEKSLSTLVITPLNELTFMVNKIKADKNTPLNDGDELYIFNPVFGG